MLKVAEQYARVDLYIQACIEKFPHLKPCCAAGCSACCYEPVYATQAEVAHIVESLTPAHRAEVMAKLPDWLASAKPLLNQNMPDAVAYRELNVPCVFLKAGLCSIYERRPHSCRAWFALKNPENCNLPQRKHQKFAIFSPGIAYAMGCPVPLHGRYICDHLGALLIEALLGQPCVTGSRINHEAKDFKM